MNLPSPNRVASLAQLERKLRKSLLKFSMMLYIFLNNVTSHAVSYRLRKVSVFPKLSRPQPALQRPKLSEQFSGTDVFNYSHHLSDRTLAGKRKQYINMFRHHFQLYDFKTIILTYPSDQLFRSVFDIFAFKDFLSIFSTPNQMVAGVVSRITRSFDLNAWFISQITISNYEDKGGANRSPL